MKDQRTLSLMHHPHYSYFCHLSQMDWNPLYGFPECQYFLFLHRFRRNPGIPTESAGIDRNSGIPAESVGMSQNRLESARI